MTFLAPRVLLSNDTTFIWNLPHGKPDRTVILENGTEDHRPRVVQPAQKGSSCQFYAMNRLRKRIGPLHGEDHENARRVERLISHFFKKKSEMKVAICSALPMLWNQLAEDCPFPSKEEVSKLFTVWKPVLMENKLMATVVPYLEEFCKSKKIHDLGEYIRIKWKSYEQALSSLLCRDLGTSFEALYMEAQDLDIDILINQQGEMSSEQKNLFKELARLKFPTWQQIAKTSLGTQLISRLVYVAAFRAFQFQISSWTPHQSIEKLRESLESEGALIVGGHFGKELYANPPTSSCEIEGHPIYSWKPADRLPKTVIESIERHAIVIIGAEQSGLKGGLVYFIDPHDPSDPLDPLQQKIYKISYENLRNNLVDNLGRAPNLQQNPPGIGYAIFYPR